MDCGITDLLIFSSGKEETSESAELIGVFKKWVHEKEGFISKRESLLEATGSLSP